MSAGRSRLLRRILIGRFSLRRLLASVVFIYAVIGAFAFFFSERLIFHPPAPSYDLGGSVFTIPIEGGERIAVRWIEVPGARLAVLYSHGNAEDLGQLDGNAARLNRLGVSVLLYDYPGYGRSEGSPTEEGALCAVEAAYRYLVEVVGIAPERIVLYGRSVGGGPTLHLAAEQPVGGVVLQAAFVSAFRVITRWSLYPFDRFPNLRNIREYDGPLLIIHGREDEVIAPWHGQALYDAATAADRSIEWIEGAHHNDLIQRAGRGFDHIMRDFLEKVESRE